MVKKSESKNGYFLLLSLEINKKKLK